MRPSNTLRILHLSDLHIGKESLSAWRMARVLGDAWTRNLEEIAAAGAIDLVCFTGDLAQSGQPEQYQEASEFVHGMLATLKVPLARFFCVPGNHDVNQKTHAGAWAELRNAFDLNQTTFSRWMAGGDGKAPRGFEDLWREQVIERQAAYRQWLAEMGLHAMLPGAVHPRLGYRISLDLGLSAPLHIVGLDSAWLAGDNHDAGKLRLTAEQIGLLLTDKGKKLPGWLIALVHHPLTDLADGTECRRLLSENGVGLLLHGHLHDAEIVRWSTPSAGLHISSAGCLYEDDHYPNSLQVLDVHLPEGKPVEPQRLWARAWSGRGYWHNDDSLYPGSVAGKVHLAQANDSAISDGDVGAFTPGQFIGREDELKQICTALQPRAGDAITATVICCTVEGMAGVGKTRLAEHFIQQYWLPALGIEEDGNSAGHYLRLVLDPQAPEPPTATGLAQQLADRLRSTGEASSLWSRLRAALQSGPHGHPQLVLIENVDSEPQSRAVGELVNRLPGCPVLVTARYQRLGGAAWKRVPVAPMTPEDARKLLLAEIEEGGHAITAQEADELARQLGYLPLALHIAASHLSLGLTPKAFLRELHAAGLDLTPAHPGDPRLTTNRARAIIRSSFALSWRHWCSGRGANEAWQQALVALAQGPPASTGLSLSAAIAAIDEEDYPAFVTAAARLSLLQYSPRDQQTEVHPLIAEFLRGKLLPDAKTVLGRISAWFLQRLAETGDAAQKQAWSEVLAESASLAHCLSLLQAEDALAMELAGQQFARRLGPYALWKDFYARQKRSDDQPQHLSRRWWLLAELARKSGDLEYALLCARAKVNVDRQQGNERTMSIGQGQIADVLQARGDLDEALRIRREEQLPVYDKLGDVRERAVTMGKIADVLQARGDLDEALRIRCEEELPVYDKLGDVRSRALTMGYIADVLEARGDLDAALRIRRAELLPIFDKLGDVRSRAVTMGQIADVLQARGELDEALRIRREEQLPVYGKLGDVRSRAVTMGQIADVLQARGELDEALRIRREEQLPVYDKLGDVRSRALTMGQIADVLQARGELDEALRIRREEQLPVYRKLGDIRSTLVAEANLAICLAQRGRKEDGAEILQLLKQAFTAAQRMRLPEAAQIAAIFKQIFGGELRDS